MARVKVVETPSGGKTGAGTGDDRIGQENSARLAVPGFGPGPPRGLRLRLRTAMELMRHTDARLTTRIYTDPKLLDTGAAINALPRLVPSSDDREADQKRAAGTDNIAASAAGSAGRCERACDPESLASGFVCSLSEQGSSIGSRLASDGTEAGEKGQDGDTVNSSKHETYGIIRHLVAPPDTPRRKPAKRRANVEAGGMYFPGHQLLETARPGGLCRPSLMPARTGRLALV
ncbi:MAG: hypothetical protein JSU86_18065 [Phycisphaerales bacterium]|nr:MAG: hypothetical protein JSU86_18065 [Phycisphaerales bacterium]